MREGSLARRIEWIGQAAVVITLVVLIMEVRANTKALERQIVLDSSSQLSTPILSSPELLAAYERVKAVDGWEPIVLALVEQYDMTHAQAVVWGRYVLTLWQGLQADYVYAGESPELTARIKFLMAFPDDRLFWSVVSGSEPPLFSRDFSDYVERSSGVGGSRSGM